MAGGATVHDLKSIILDKLGIPPDEQRLSVKASNGGGETPLLFGPIITSRLQKQNNTITVTVEHVILDAKLKSLYSNVGMKDWAERDEIMAKMAKSRKPGQCPGGHELATIPYADWRTNENKGRILPCFKCHKDPSRIFICGATSERVLICDQCKFCLCGTGGGNSCCIGDQGWTPTSEPNGSPYTDLKAFALENAEHLAGYDLVRFRSFNIHSEFAPSSWKSGVAFEEDTKVVHDGARLIVRLSSTLHESIQQAGLAEEIIGNDVAVTSKGIVDVEVLNELRPQGAAITNLETVLRNFYNSHTGKFLRQAWIKNGGRIPRMNLHSVSYDLNEVAYEIHIHEWDPSE